MLILSINLQKNKKQKTKKNPTSYITVNNWKKKTTKKLLYLSLLVDNIQIILLSKNKKYNQKQKKETRQNKTLRNTKLQNHNFNHLVLVE